MDTQSAKSYYVTICDFIQRRREFAAIWIYPGDPFSHVMPLYQAELSNYTNYQVRGEITYVFPNFNSANVDV